MTVIQMVVTVDEHRVEMALTSVMDAVSDAELATWLGSDVVQIMQERARARFASEGDDASGRWAPLAPSTIEDRLRSGYGGAHPINRRTGELERAITGATGAVEAFGGGTQLTFPGVSDTGTDLSFKISTAQRGNDRSTSRPVAAVGYTDLELILVSMAVHIEQALMRAL